MSKNIMFNELPRPTFRWLKNNYTEGELWQKGSNKAEIEVIGNKNIVMSLRDTNMSKPAYKGANEEALQEVVNNATNAFLVKVPANSEEKVEFHINLKGAEVMERTRIRFEVAKGAKLEVLLSLTGDEQAENSIQLFTEVAAATDAVVVIKKVQLLGENTQQIEHHCSNLEESSKLEYINLEIGGKENFLNYENNLIGTESQFIHDLAYLGDKEQRFDISMLMSHVGKKSFSDIHSIGALGGTSKKSFRGTLDFLRGSIQAEGAEEDTCLLLNKNVKSVSLPLLLCKEDNVSGNHAASAGQIDQNKLFYLMSRGFSEVEAKHIIVESMLRPIIDRIHHPELEEKTLTAVRSKI